MTDTRCSIARTIRILGDRWTVLIVREAFWGKTRFSQFRDSLGVSTDILTARLSTLVDHGIMEKRPYRDDGDRERIGYHLTEAGVALRPVLAALNEWGTTYEEHENGSASRYVRAATGEPVHIAFVTSTGEILPWSDVEAVRSAPHPVTA
jgi:DNA-binding HxlR family transcriptional regulator